MCNSQSDVPGLAQRVRAEKQAPPRAWVTPAFLDGCLWKTINFFLMSLLVHQVCRNSTSVQSCQSSGAVAGRHQSHLAVQGQTTLSLPFSLLEETFFSSVKRSFSFSSVLWLAGFVSRPIPSVHWSGRNRHSCIPWFPAQLWVLVTPDEELPPLKHNFWAWLYKFTVKGWF